MNAYQSIKASLDLFRENYPSRVIVAGSSGSGKSTLVKQIIERYKHLFDVILICGSRDTVDDIKNKDDENRFVLSEKILDPFEYSTGKNRVLYVLDDLFSELVNDPIVNSVQCRGRHAGIQTIFIYQNLFASGKFARSISLNATHFFLLKNRDLSQVETLGRQLVGKTLAPRVVSAYKTALRLKPHGYLLIDLTQTEDILQFRTNVFDERQIVYDIES